MKTLTIALGLLLATTAGATAGEKKANMIGGGPIVQGDQTVAVCYFINEGTKSIVPTTQALFEEGSSAPIPSSPDCASNQPVQPGVTCSIVSAVPLSVVGVSCQVKFATRPKEVRGTLDVRNDTGVLVTTELR